MTTLNLSPKNPAVMAVLALGAFWLLTQRRANSATLKGNTVNPASKAFFVSPAAASLRQSGQGTAQAQGNLISTALTSVLNTIAPNRTVSGPWGDYYPAHLGKDVSAEADGTAGEAAARAVYLANPDQFVANPPSLYQQQQWAANAAAEQSTGGYLDSQ